MPELKTDNSESESGSQLEEKKVHRAEKRLAKMALPEGLSAIAGALYTKAEEAEFLQEHFERVTTAIQYCQARLDAVGAPDETPERKI